MMSIPSRRSLWLALLFAMLLSGCAGTVVRSEVTAFHEASADFGDKTYGFVREAPQQNVLEYRSYEDLVRANVLPGTVVHADEAAHWDRLTAFFPIKRINHQVAYSKDGANTNQAESFFSRLRRAEIGIHHHIAGRHLHAYAAEMAWREDASRIDNGTQYTMAVAAAAVAPQSDMWCGYWQRRLTKKTV